MCSLTHCTGASVAELDSLLEPESAQWVQWVLFSSWNWPTALLKEVMVSLVGFF